MTARRSPPADLAPDGRGRRLWRRLLVTYDFAPRELALLHELTRSLDRVDEVRAIVAADGPVVAGSRGQRVAHPLLAEERAHRVIIARIAAMLDLPDATKARPGDGTDQITSLASVRARSAARARWGNRGAAGAG